MEQPEPLKGVPLPRLQRALEARERALYDLIARQREAVDYDTLASEPAGDEADQAQDRERKMVDGDLLDLYLAELGEVAAARQRIATGTYGLCADCGEPISARRLEVQPTARRCLACQARRERFSAIAP